MHIKSYRNSWFVFFFAILGCFLPLELSAQQVRSLGYEIQRNGSPVGQGFISVEQLDGKTLVTYRMNIVVKLMSIPVYRLDSEQLAVFDADRQLMFAKTKANIDGDEHAVKVIRSGGVFQVEHNQSKSELVKGAFVGTTLDPVFCAPNSGLWLDLTNSSLVKYDVQKTPNYYHLTRPDGEDKLYLDSEKFIKQLESSISRGTLTMNRTMDQQGATAQDRLPHLFDIHASRQEALSAVSG